MPNVDYFEIPAIMSTQVNLLVSDDGWRISFGEQTGETTSLYHVAVFLPMATALRLTELLAQTVQKQNAAKTQTG